MKRYLAVLFMAFIAPPVNAAFDSKGWEWRAPLEIQQNASAGFVQVDLAPWVFDRSQSGLADLRVVDGTGALTPHLVRWGQAAAQSHTDWQTVRLVNRTYEPNEYARIVADFGGNTEKDSVKVVTSGANFRRRVMIEGSADSATWERIADDLYLFDISAPNQRFQTDTLRFAPNNFRYLRLTVFHMPEDPRQIEIESVQGARTYSEKVELTDVPVANVSLRQDEKSRETICELDLGFKNLPVARVDTDVSDPYFYRGCVIEGRNTLTEKIRRRTETGWDETERESPWNAVQNGVISRMKDGGKSSASLAFYDLRAPYRYLRIRIFNGDNPPLSLRAEGVKVQRRGANVTFEAKPGNQYFLLGGNPAAGSPDFDLTRAVANLEKQKYPSVVLGAPTTLTHEKESAPWTERHKLLIGLALVIAAAAVAALLLSSLRGLRKQDTPPSSPG